MNRKRIINVYIIINIVVDLAHILLHIVTQDINKNEVASERIRIIVYSFYHVGYFVVFYNIVDVNVKDDQEMKPGTDRKQFNNIV